MAEHMREECARRAAQADPAPLHAAAATPQATVHQRAFAAAAAGPSADRAVVEGAIMLARTVVHLAASPDERDRVLAAQQRRGSGVEV